MLRLAYPRPADGQPLVLHRVGGWQLHADLQRYVDNALRSRWPEMRLVCTSEIAELALSDVDLWLCGQPPPTPTRRPALVLGAVSRDASLARIGEQLWYCATPVNARILIRHVERVLSA